MKVLLAAEKPFAKTATDGIRKIVEQAGFTFALLEKYTDPADLIAAVADADALIVRSDKVTAEVVAAAAKLKIVVRAGAGYDNLDLGSLTARGIVAMNTPGQNSNAVAELALGMMIYMARNQFTPGTGGELSGKTLGIHGWGHVGALVAKYGQGMGMQVYAYRRQENSPEIKAAGAIQVGSVEELYQKSQYISLHIPANAQTRESINGTLAKLMPRGGVIVNTARKEVICEKCLIEAMLEREDLKYATDIAPDAAAEFAEKLGKRYFATPKKQGAETAEANINAGLAAASQIVDYLKNGNTTFQVNKA